MIGDSVMGAIYLSIIDMVLLLVFLYVLGVVLKLFPLINKVKFSSKEAEGNDNSTRSS